MTTDTAAHGHDTPVIDQALADLASRVGVLTVHVDDLAFRLDDLTARVVALETPPARPDPLADLPGWRNVFADDFDRTVAKGKFTAGGNVVNWTTSAGVVKTAGTRTSDGRYIAFGTNPLSNWQDTSRHGTYGESAVISIANGKLTMDVYSDANGYGHTCVITPLPTGGSNRGGITFGRSLVRARADSLPGFKGVWLWWSDTATDNDMLTDGEIDGPEGPFNAVPKAYLHRKNGTSSSDQVSFTYPPDISWQDWHDYVTEWTSGRVRYLVDGRLVGETTDRTPTAAMHFNIQPETNTGSGPWPAANVTGKLEIERVGLWVPA